MILRLVNLILSIKLLSCVNPTAAVDQYQKKYLTQMSHNLQTINYKNYKISYAWSGDTSKRPLVFVHGSPGGWNGWSEFLVNPELQNQYHIIAIDRHGYGQTNKGKSETSLSIQAQEIVEVLKNNKSNLPAILVGHSYGGPVIARAAIDHQSKFAGLIFVASSVAPDLEKIKWFQYPAAWWPISWLLPSDLRVCNEEIMGLKSELQFIEPMWSQITAKVAIVHGENDDLVPVENVEFLKKVLKPENIVSLKRIENLNHFVPWKRPDLILSAIKEVSSRIE